MTIEPYNRLGSLTVTYSELCDFLGEEVIEELEEWALFPNLELNKNAVCKAFHIRYDCREIGYDMPYKFINRLSYKFMELGPRYDFAFRKYKVDSDNIDKVGRTTLSDADSTRTLATSDNTSTERSNNSSYYDTPKTNLPDPLTNPTNVSTDKMDDTAARNIDTSDTQTAHSSVSVTDKQYIEDLNKVIDEYRGLITQFVNDLEALFLQVKSMEG